MGRLDTFYCLTIISTGLGCTPCETRLYYHELADACDALAGRTHDYLESGFEDKGVEDRTRILRNKNWTEIKLSVSRCRFEL